MHELAKELGVTSKEILARLSEQGEFVKSASSTVEAPTARRLRESFGGASPAKPPPTPTPTVSIRVRDLATELGVTNRQILSFLRGQGEAAATSSSGVNLVIADRVRAAFNDARRFVVAPVPTDRHDPDALDSLGIDFDACALAALIASTDMKPPWAIGIYGPWGSGKTFLMRRIERWIRSLENTADLDRVGTFEHGIAHVWFSAWHYSAGSSSANIWASIMIHIFEALHPKLSERQQKIADVLSHVDAAREIRDNLQKRVDVAQSAERNAQRLVTDAERKYEAALKEATKVRTRDLSSAISASELGDLSGLNEAAATLGLDQVGSSARQIAERAKQVTDLGSQAKILATAGNRFASPLAWALYGLVAVLGITWILTWVLFSQELSTLAVLSTGQFVALSTAAGAWIGRQGVLARAVLKPAEAIQSKITKRMDAVRHGQEQDLRAAQERESAAAAELCALKTKLSDATADVAAVENERDSLTGQELLRRFLSERAETNDYDQHKGVVALVHRDLEQLSDHLTAALQESADTSGLRRIVLYIDDLDRCDPPTVANVLAAVHLLLALPLFTSRRRCGPQMARAVTARNSYRLVHPHDDGAERGRDHRQSAHHANGLLGENLSSHLHGAHPDPRCMRPPD